MATIKVRFIQMISVSIIMCMILIFFVTWFSWTIAQRSREVQALTTSLQDMARQADSEYNDILQLSQNMVPTGPIGQIYDQYLTSTAQYDRFKTYGNFINSLNIATFGMDDVLLSAYYIPGKEQAQGKILFSSFTPRSGFAPEAIPELGRTKEIIFQPLHQTSNNVLLKNVVSVLRPVTFSNNTEGNIYLEIATDIPGMLREKEQIEGISYIFLQTDQKGRVIYSSSDVIAAGMEIVADQQGMIQMNRYIGVQKKSQYGFSYALMMPVREYVHRNTRWVMWIFTVVLISFAILAVVAFSQIWFFQHPLTALEEEMNAFDGTDFQDSQYRGNIKEFDRLFASFNRMKQQIYTLIVKNEKQMEEKTMLELEKLKYQINPHFLMNALNTVRWMSVVRKADDITAYVTHLGYILSYSLGKTDCETTLRTELKVLQNYLELQQTTYDFEFVMDVEEGEYLNQPCARFLLQPVAENSVCHNMDEFGHLWIRVREEAGKIHISLEDDGKGFSAAGAREDEGAETGQKNKGIGLRYLQMTLDAVYGSSAQLKIDSVVGEGTTVHIVIPENDVIPESDEDVQGSDC